MMRLLPAILLLNLFSVSTLHAKANCQHSSSWQCANHAGTSSQGSQTSGGIATSGNTPNTGTTNTPLGTQTPTQPQVQITPIAGHQIAGTGAIPPKPKPMKVPPKQNIVAPPMIVKPLPQKVFTGYGAVPQPKPIAVPPKQPVVAPPMNVYPQPPQVFTGQGAVPQPQPMMVPPKQPIVAPPMNVYPLPQQVFTGQGAVPQPQPMMVPPKQPVVAPPINVYPQPQPVITGQGAVPQPKPNLVPPKPPIATPPQNVYLIPSQTVTGQGGVPARQPVVVPPQVTQPGVQAPQPTAIITHVPSSNLHPNTLLRQQTLHNGNKFEQIEPTLNNTHVDVYRGKDASKMLYKDTLPMDKRGFHLTVLGIKEPTFIDDGEPLEEALRDFTFYFDFASAEIKPEQTSLFTRIIDEHRKTGKRIIIVGETDNFGSEEYNRHLAVHRSTKIIAELKTRGVKDDEVELRVLVRCCRIDHPTKATLAETRDQRITWVHFE